MHDGEGPPENRTRNFLKSLSCPSHSEDGQSALPPCRRPSLKNGFPLHENSPDDLLCGSFPSRTVRFARVAEAICCPLKRQILPENAERRAPTPATRVATHDLFHVRRGRFSPAVESNKTLRRMAGKKRLPAPFLRRHAAPPHTPCDTLSRCRRPPAPMTEKQDFSSIHKERLNTPSPVRCRKTSPSHSLKKYRSRTKTGQWCRLEKQRLSAPLRRYSGLFRHGRDKTAGTP